jgi:hypothetical protein
LESPRGGNYNADGRRVALVNWGSPTPLEDEEPSAIDDDLFDADEPDDSDDPDEADAPS